MLSIVESGCWAAANITTRVLAALKRILQIVEITARRVFSNLSCLGLKEMR